MKPLITLCLVFLIKTAFSQDTINPFIRLTNPSKAANDTKWSRQFIIGATCKTCSLSINNKPVKVYPTGAFAHEINLIPGDSTFVLIAYGNAKTSSKRLTYSYTLFRPAEPVKTFSIESVQTFPEGNLVLMPGDKIKFKVKALPGCMVKTVNGQPLYEMPLSQTNGMPGIYQGEYTIAGSDTFAVTK